jgi:hypothetical protein
MFAIDVVCKTKREKNVNTFIKAGTVRPLTGCSEQGDEVMMTVVGCILDKGKVTSLLGFLSLMALQILLVSHMLKMIK